MSFSQKRKTRLRRVKIFWKFDTREKIFENFDDLREEGERQTKHVWVPRFLNKYIPSWERETRNISAIQIPFWKGWFENIEDFEDLEEKKTHYPVELFILLPEQNQRIRSPFSAPRQTAVIHMYFYKANAAQCTLRSSNQARIYEQTTKQEAKRNAINE